MRLPQIGQKFRDRYLVERLLGEGAFGAVYAATDTAAGRPVALKILKPDGPDGTYDPKTKARFDREIKVVANLRSPYTVSLFDCGATEDGLLFSVFEHVPGEDLSEHLLRVGRLAPPATVHVARQVLESLQEAHARGLLHRDIKPHNIRVFPQPDGSLGVKVLDFGLARGMREDRPAVTEQGEVIGTPRYMAPEQLMDAQITPASDVYSLGIVMLEMLLGVEALHGTKFSDQLERLRTGHVFSLHGLEQSGLAPIITRMTARDATLRFPDAAAALRALDEWRPGAPPPSGQYATSWPSSSSSSGVMTRPMPYSGSSGQFVTQAEQPTSNNQTLIWIAAGVVTVVVGLVIIAVSIAPQDHEPVPPPKPRPVTPALIAGEQPPKEEPTLVPVEDPDLGPTTGCGSQAPFTGKGYLERSSLVARHQWLTYVPKDYDPARQYPLMFLIHPTGQTPEDLLNYSRFDTVAEEHDFIVVAPQDFDTLSWRDGAREIETILEAKRATVESLCIDERRVFVTSQGHGGYLSYELSCEPWVTGIATNAFRMDRSMLLCSDELQRPNLLLSPNKGQDPWEGGANCTGGQKRSVEEVEELWRERNGCKGARKRTFDHEKSACFTWSCETPFVSCHIDGGHNWPGSPSRAMDLIGCDGESPDFPMAERVWAFFDSLDPLEPVAP